MSSDADSSTPDILSSQLRGLVREHGFGIEQMLRFGATNAAHALGLERKGRVAVGCDADLLVLEQGTLDIRDVIVRGARMVIDGTCVVRERFVAQSSRRWTLGGNQASPPSSGDPPRD